MLGLTFKPGTDDLRDAPSLVNIPLLLEDGAHVKAWDPVGADNFRKLFPNEINYCESIEDTLLDADMCFIFTEWEEIKNFPLYKYKELMKNPLILDGRNCYSLTEVEKNGLVYESIGRRKVNT